MDFNGLKIAQSCLRAVTLLDELTIGWLAQRPPALCMHDSRYHEGRRALNARPLPNSSVVESVPVRELVPRRRQTVVVGACAEQSREVTGVYQDHCPLLPDRLRCSECSAIIHCSSVQGSLSHWFKTKIASSILTRPGTVVEEAFVTFSETSFKWKDNGGTMWQSNGFITSSAIMPLASLIALVKCQMLRAFGWVDSCCTYERLCFVTRSVTASGNNTHYEIVSFYLQCDFIFRLITFGIKNRDVPSWENSDQAIFRPAATFLGKIRPNRWQR